MSRWVLSIVAVTAAAILNLGGVGETQAQTLNAHLERNPIRSDETVRLVIETDTKTNSAQPDVTPLQRDFEILGQSTNTHITFENGRRYTRIRWLIELAPKRAGRFTIGPLRVGTLMSPAIVLEVQPATTTATGSSTRDVFLETEVTPQKVYVQSQLTYTLRIYRAAEFLDAQLSSFNPADAITHRLGKDATYAKTINGQRYQIIERRFAVFPQASGRLTLPAMRLDVRISTARFNSLRSRLFDQGRQMRVASQPFEIIVKPRPGVAATPWLPARAVTFTETWSEEPSHLVVGTPVTWTLRLDAAGLTGEQLPPIVLPDFDGVRRYPDQPSIVTHVDRDTVRGIHTQRIAVVPSTAGELQIPTLRIQWWDVEADAPRTAQIPARTVTVVAAPITGVTGAVPPVAPVTAPRLLPSNRLWPSLSAVLLVAWLVTLGAWLRARHSSAFGKLHQSDSASPPASTKSPRDLAAARYRVVDACRDDTPRTARDALLDWAALTWPELPPQDLVVLATRVHDAPLTEAILALDRALWSAQGIDWIGQSLLTQLPHKLGPPLAPPRPSMRDGLPSLHPT